MLHEILIDSISSRCKAFILDESWDVGILLCVSHLDVLFHGLGVGCHLAEVRFWLLDRREHAFCRAAMLRL